MQKILIGKVMLLVISNQIVTYICAHKIIYSWNFYELILKTLNDGIKFGSCMRPVFP